MHFHKRGVHLLVLHCDIAMDTQEGIRGALNDDSVLVREAAVDLIGK
jgi:hypothetical protein